MQSGRPTVLVIHDDGDALDLLTRLFEAAELEVVTAVTLLRAQAHLESLRSLDFVVAPWDAAHPIGGEVYRWALQLRYDLRDRFVFLAAEAPPELDRIVAGRCLMVSPARPAEAVYVALAAIRRRARLAEPRGPAVAELDVDQPTLLLADDDPALLAAMADVLGDAGYVVTRAESGHAAIAMLDSEDFDAVAADWHMDSGSGAEVYRWLVVTKPWLVDRLVFLADSAADDPAAVAPGRPVFRKGADAGPLLAALREIAGRARG